jgi:hypothetical protein
MEHYFKSDQPFKTTNVPAFPPHVPEKSKATIVHQLHTDLDRTSKLFLGVKFEDEGEKVLKQLA